MASCHWGQGEKTSIRPATRRSGGARAPFGKARLSDRPAAVIGSKTVCFDPPRWLFQAGPQNKSGSLPVSPISPIDQIGLISHNGHEKTRLLRSSGRWTKRLRGRGETRLPQACDEG